MTRIVKSGEMVAATSESVSVRNSLMVIALRAYVSARSSAACRSRIASRAGTGGLSPRATRRPNATAGAQACVGSAVPSLNRTANVGLPYEDSFGQNRSRHYIVRVTQSHRLENDFRQRLTPVFPVDLATAHEAREVG